MTKEDCFKIVVAEILAKALENASKYREYGSAHEALAILQEEVAEVVAHVRTRESNRNLNAFRAELIDVGAVNLRFLVEIIDGGRGHE